MNPYEKLFVNLFVMSTLGLSLYYLLPSVLGALAFPIVKSMPDVFFMPTKDSPLHIEHGLRRLNAGLMTVRKGGAEAGQIYQCKRSIMEAVGTSIHTRYKMAIDEVIKVTFFIGSQLEMKEE